VNRSSLEKKITKYIKHKIEKQLTSSLFIYASINIAKFVVICCFIIVEIWTAHGPENLCW